MCIIGKKENKYIREFLDYYKKFGVDKIFLYDNNEKDDERFEDIISNYIIEGFVEIINYRGESAPQIKIFNECYKNNYKNYDWLMFYDIDEFIYLKNYINIKLFLNENKFNKCQRIALNWVMHTDNNLIHYDNRSLFERFPEKEKKAKYPKPKFKGTKSIKSIIRGNLTNITINEIHGLTDQVIGCNGFGKIINFMPNTKTPDFRNFYIDHYYSKSTEEFIIKINKGDAFFANDVSQKIKRLQTYFKFNKMTKEKVIYFERETKLNITKYINMNSNFNLSSYKI